MNLLSHFSTGEACTMNTMYHRTLFNLRYSQRSLVDKNIVLERIYNVNETGLLTVQQPSNVYAETGQKQVGGIVLVEWGTLVTMINGINAVGNSVPPYFVFPRVHFKDFMLVGAPPGSDGVANPSGWSTEAIFFKYMDHFIEHTNPSCENCIILILDNHESHMSPEVINKADDAGKLILIFRQLNKIYSSDITFFVIFCLQEL